MSRLTDEEIMACVDGEAPEALCLKLERALENDPEVARRWRQMQESRTILQDVFQGVLDEPVPERLLAGLDESPRPARRRVRLPSLALAASVLLAATVWLLGDVDRGAAGEADLAQAELVLLALNSRLSGEPVNGEHAGKPLEVMPMASWKREDGSYCRDLELIGEAVAEGVQRARACQRDGRWALQLLAGGDGFAGAEDVYRPAGGQASETGPGQQLTPDEEAKARDAGWE